jgi:hypothetical protein
MPIPKSVDFPCPAKIWANPKNILAQRLFQAAQSLTKPPEFATQLCPALAHPLIRW